MTRSPEYRIIRWDFELTKMKKRGVLSSNVKGEAVERLIGTEINSEVGITSGKQITSRGTICNGSDNSSECDLIFRGDWSGGETGTVVNGDNIICVLEAKSDLEKTEIEEGSSSINRKIQNLRGFTDAPIFLVGIRHDHTPDELRKVSVADETVAFGALSERDDAEKMANKGELKRLAVAVRNAARSFE